MPNKTRKLADKIIKSVNPTAAKAVKKRRSRMKKIEKALNKKRKR